MIRLNAFFRIKEDKIEPSIEAARELVEASRRDKGCVSYDFFRSTTRPDVMMFCETWESEEDLKDHSESEHFRRLVPVLKEYASDSKTERFDF
ncbi:MAG: antibiotic biosynthesis monooxygenase [Bacteroidales bacterium]|nr:antibiotic biosynthesis monooxygenase [Bacteroidales bacterium]MBD5283675.1 antibiotic biosynthesis monooxygenase [Bacteroides sp.]